MSEKRRLQRKTPAYNFLPPCIINAHASIRGWAGGQAPAGTVVLGNGTAPADLTGRPGVDWKEASAPRPTAVMMAAGMARFIETRPYSSNRSEWMWAEGTPSFRNRRFIAVMNGGGPQT